MKCKQLRRCGVMPSKRSAQWHRRRRLWKHRWREGDRLDKVDFHKRLRSEIAVDRGTEYGRVELWQ
jgi:hypothetical protein